MRGSLQLGRIGRLPLHFHWSLPIGLYVFTGFRFDAVRWACWLALVLIHELGHAAVVRAVGARATGIAVTGFGGVCRWEGQASPIARAAIAWGGIWAQLVVLALAEACFLLKVPLDPQVAWMATISNASMIAFNLLPFAPLDGAEAWQLPYLLGRRARAGVTRFQDPVHTLDDEALEAPTPRADAARALAAQLLSDAAKKDEP